TTSPIKLCQVVVLAVILLLALVGNGLVLVVLLRRKQNHSPLHQFMLNLCVADLVVALFQVLPQLVWDARGRFPGPDFLCRLVKYLQVLGMFASSYMIVAMTVDRHYAICCPCRRTAVVQQSAGTRSYCWRGVSPCYSVFIFSRSEVAPGVYECWGHFAPPWGLKAYVTWMTLAIFIIPVLIITFCQSLYRRSEPPPAVGSTHPHKASVARGGEVTAAMSKTVKMTLVIVLVYSICWAPFFSVQLWAAWDPDPPQRDTAFTLLMLLASLNSCTNPWIYSAFSSSVSPELRLLLFCRKPPHRRSSFPNDSTATHTSNS
uniref:Arginine vasopressin receptor 2 n=1 Tax=Poecilia latipinna TaxID=48699 RepID=A0A3B3UVA9_9TELE